MEIECTQRLECTQELYNTQAEKTDPEQIGFLGICGAKYPVKRGPNKIGRDPQACGIHLDLNSVSRQHAVINVLSLSDIMLMDLDSSNKTKIQGKTLQPYIPHQLSNGDMVQFGAIFGVFRLLEDDTDLPMTQAIDLPCTPVPAPKQMPKLGAPVLVPESPDVSDMDDSFVMPSQPKKSSEFKSPMNKFIKQSNKTIAIQPMGSKTIDNAYWASTKKSDSFNFQLDDSGSSLNDSTASNKSNKVIEESNDNIHEMETQQPYKANDSTDSIYTANTQVPPSPSVHCIETQPPVLDIHMQETQQVPDIHAVDTQIVHNTVHNCDTQAPISDNAIHNCETQAPVNDKLPEVCKLDDQEDLQLDLYTDNKENDNSIFNAETQAFPAAKEAVLTEPKKTEQIDKSVDELSKDKSASDEEIMFDEINTQSFYGECESQPIIPAGNVSPQIERIEKIEVSLNKIRRESGSSTDCEDIDLLPTQNILKNIDILPTQKILPDVKKRNDIDILPTQKIVDDIEMLSTQKIVANNDDDDLTDCEDDELCNQEMKESKDSPEIDFEDMATQIIGDDVIEAEINKKTDQTDGPSKGISFEELPTQLITDDCKEDNLEVMPTQIITNEEPNKIPNEEVYSEEIISPFKIPSASPYKSKKTPTSTLTKTAPKVVVTKSDDDDHPNYYAATQDIFNDLCSQREPSPEANKANPTNRNENCQDDDLVPCSVEDYEMGDRFRHIESDLSPLKKTKSVEKVSSEQSSEVNVLKTPKTLKIMNIDLPDSQEIKTSVSLKQKSMTESSSDSETDDVSDQDSGIIYGKKRKPKINAKQDLSKKFEESLPSRVITRVRKPTLKVRESDEAIRTSKIILKNLVLGDSDDSVDSEIINENISRLKSKTDKRKEKDDHSKRQSEESKKRPHSRNEKNKKDESIEDSTKDSKSRSSRSKTKKAEEMKSKADDQKESGDKKVRSTRSTRNKKDSKDVKEDKSKKEKEHKQSKENKGESKSKTRSDSKPRSDSKSRSDSKTRSESKPRSDSKSRSNSNTRSNTRSSSKSNETKHEKTKTPETDVRRSSRQKKDSKEVTPKHENSTIYLSSESSTESPKTLKRPATNQLEVPSPKRTRSLPSSKSDSVSTTPGSASVCSTPVRVDTQYVLFTAFSNDDVRSKLENLGAVLVTDVMSCTVLVTLQIKRTFKLLCAVGLGRPIVGPDWVQACADTNSIVDPWLYIMKDAAAERRFHFSLEKTLRGRRHFLKGYNVSATPSVLPTAQEMKLIVECSGGSWKAEGPNWVCVTSSSDRSLWGPLRRRGATLVSTEFILGGVLRQQADVAATMFGDPGTKKKATTVGDFVCEECGRRCLSRIGLASHARSHTRS